MKNDTDILICFVGLYIILVGAFGAVTMKFPVGFRGMHPLFLRGANAQKLGIVCLLGGIILSITGFLSWILNFPRVLLLILCTIAGSPMIIAYLIGTFVAEYKQED